MTFARATSVCRDLIDHGFNIAMAGGRHPEHGEHFSVEVVAHTLEHEQLERLFGFAQAQGLRVRFDSQRVRLMERPPRAPAA